MSKLTATLQKFGLETSLLFAGACILLALIALHHLSGASEDPVFSAVILITMLLTVVLMTGFAFIGMRRYLLR